MPFFAEKLPMLLNAQKCAFAAQCAAEGDDEWAVESAFFPIDTPVEKEWSEYQSYLNFLRKTKKTTVARYYTALQEGERLKNDPEITEWLQKIGAKQNRSHFLLQKESKILGAGASGVAVLVREKVLKVFYADLKEDQILPDIFATHLSHKLPKTPSLEAIFSDENQKIRAILMNKMEGVPLGKMSKTAITNIPDAHWNTLFSTLVEMHHSLLFAETITHLNNVLYDKENTFSIVDPQLRPDGGLQLLLAEAIGTIGLHATVQWGNTEANNFRERLFSLLRNFIENNYDSSFGR